MSDALVVKVGGSLADLPHLGIRLRHWLDALPVSRVLLVPGGGVAADLVREADALDHLGEECSHWLALKALEFMAYVLAARLPGTLVIDDIADRLGVWQRGQIPILNLHAFARADEALPGHLPHRWDVTSDSLAARVAAVAGIEILVLLKSCEGIPPPQPSPAGGEGESKLCTPQPSPAGGEGESKSCTAQPSAARGEGESKSGIVDAAFPDVLESIGNRLRVRVVNFRRWASADANAAAPPDPGL